MWAMLLALSAMVCFAAGAEANADSIDSIALPVILMTGLLTGVGVTIGHVRAAYGRSADRAMLALVVSSSAIFILSLFVLVSSGWAHAAVSAVLAHVIVIAAGTGVLDGAARQLLLLTGLWFAILIGVPSPLSGGIIASAAIGDPTTFPQLTTVSESPWQIAVLVFSTLIIGLTAVQIVALLGSMYQLHVVTRTEAVNA